MRPEQMVTSSAEEDHGGETGRDREASCARASCSSVRPRQREGDQESTVAARRRAQVAESRSRVAMAAAPWETATRLPNHGWFFRGTNVGSPPHVSRFPSVPRETRGTLRRRTMRGFDPQRFPS